MKYILRSWLKKNENNILKVLGYEGLTKDK